MPLIPSSQCRKDTTPLPNPPAGRGPTGPAAELRYHAEAHREEACEEAYTQEGRTEQGPDRAASRRRPAGPEIQGRPGTEGTVRHEGPAGRVAPRAHAGGGPVRPGRGRERLRRSGRRDRGAKRGGPPGVRQPGGGRAARTAH